MTHPSHRCAPVPGRVPVPGQVSVPGQVRLLTWNVWDLRGDVAAVVRVLRALDPDVVCLQEVPRRLDGPARVARLARAAGLTPGAGGRGSGGTAILLGPRVQRLAARTVRLPVPPLARTRGAALCTVRVSGLELAVVSVHLPLTPARRLAHARTIHEVARASGLPVAVAGDLNEPPGSPAWQLLAGLVTDPAPQAPATFPARSPHSRLDAVLIGSGLRLVRHGPDDAAGEVTQHDVLVASDHRPVLAVIAAAPAG